MMRRNRYTPKRQYDVVLSQVYKPRRQDNRTQEQKAADLGFTAEELAAFEAEAEKENNQ